ncbi:hypothetical protein O4H53_04875 [Sulfitobacter sp. G21635-S1]|uniref:hypothetical protein n=1 Tax=Sulfitobacter sp. G21635-S1 TaxID=3014043 RepID=UPI0022AFF944|nr:hypothetical protein [Sulfitobacter sp. G21635-S1]MCZ4254862.1 hypothetical protein [Sulfitobacter sp. G21635-S1]
MPKYSSPPLELFSSLALRRQSLLGRLEVLDLSSNRMLIVGASNLISSPVKVSDDEQFEPMQTIEAMDGFVRLRYSALPAAGNKKAVEAAAATAWRDLAHLLVRIDKSKNS